MHLSRGDTSQPWGEVVGGAEEGDEGKEGLGE